MYSRRDFAKLTLSAMAVSPWPDAGMLGGRQLRSTVRGVRIGLITGGFAGGRGQRGAGVPETAAPPPAGDPADAIIRDLVEIGAANIELSANLYGAPAIVGGAVGGQAPATLTPDYVQSREAVRQWRLTAPLDRFREVRQKFEAAGLNLFSHVITIADDFTDAEIDAAFRQMQALGVSVFCTNQTRVGMGPRIKSFAEQYRIRPAFHTHALVDDPNEVASPASLERLIAMSPMFMINLDIGHFTAGNQDAVACIRQYHDRITHLHVKDRKRNNGPSVIWGTGDTPIDACLRLIRDNQWPIACIIERDNRDETGSPIELAKKYLAYMTRVLES